MVEETISNTGAVPRIVSADVGYYSARAVDDLQALGVDSFIALDQTRHGRVLPPAPKRPALAQLPKRPISTPNFSAGLVVDPRANFLLHPGNAAHAELERCGELPTRDS